MILCKNKTCKQGNFGKRLKFEPRTASQLYCCYECLKEDSETKSYKAEIAKRIKANNAKEKRIFRAEGSKNKRNNPLQVAVNKLIKLIDKRFELNTCICCDKPFQGQIDASHFKSVGSNSSLRYNLHNIHSGRGYCNQYDPNHQKNYPSGLEKRYGKEYLNYVESLALKYPHLSLSGVELIEKTSLVTRIIKNFNTYKLESPTQARDMFNEIIKIYL